jgi:uncharacterized protein (TIGR02246 family)
MEPLLEVSPMKSRSWIVLALGLAAGIGLVATRPASGAAGDTDAVKKSCQSIVEAWNRHDGKAIAAVFADDGDVINPMGRKATGKAELEALFTEEQAGPMRESRIEVKDEPIRFPSADIAVSDAEVVITGIYGPDGKKMGPTDFHVTNVWKKVGDDWKVFSCRPYMKMPPPAPAPTR